MQQMMLHFGTCGPPLARPFDHVRGQLRDGGGEVRGHAHEPIHLVLGQRACFRKALEAVETRLELKGRVNQNKGYSVLLWKGREGGARASIDTRASSRGSFALTNAWYSSAS